MDDIDKKSEEFSKNVRRFFALCKEAGYDDGKDRVKKKYKLEHFLDITPEQLTETIKQLQHYIDNKMLGISPTTKAPPSVIITPTVTSKYGSF